MEIKEYAPVIIPTLNRYEHLKRLIISLEHNTHAEETELVIGLDYPPSNEYVDGYVKIRSYLPTITGFKKVKVLTSEHNIGQALNTKRLREYVESQGYSAFILTEDDNEFSPCFLDYMNQALERYRDSEKVINVCGYSPFKYNGGENIYFARYMSGWGFGVWLNKSKELARFFTLNYLELFLNDFAKSISIYLKRPSLLNRVMNQVVMSEVHSDVCHVLYRFINDCYSVYPSISLVRNHGNDGTGVHCKKIDKTFENQVICTDARYVIEETEIKEQMVVRKMYARVGSKPWYANVAILFRYLIWYITRKDIFAVLRKR